MRSPLLQVNHLSAGYPSGASGSHKGTLEILRDVSLEIGRGEMVALLGSNGAGKTTLCSALSALIKPTSGSIYFDSVDLTALDYTEVVGCGLIQVPEGRKIFPNLSVQENLLLGAYKRGQANRLENLEKVFSTFPRLKERSNQLAGSMSGGEQQMLAIGRGMMAEPKLLVLDEPSLGLSPLLVEEMFELIVKLKQSDLSILLVEQNVGQSLECADRAYVLENGSVRFSGTPDELLASDELRLAYLGL